MAAITSFFLAKMIPSSVLASGIILLILYRIAPSLVIAIFALRYLAIYLLALYIAMWVFPSMAIDTFFNDYAQREDVKIKICKQLNDKNPWVARLFDEEHCTDVCFKYAFAKSDRYYNPKLCTSLFYKGAFERPFYKEATVPNGLTHYQKLKQTAEALTKAQKKRVQKTKLGH